MTRAVNTHSGNDFERGRKQEFQGSLVETTFDLAALTFALQQVETVSWQPGGPSVSAFLVSPRGSLRKYYHFAEVRSDKHGVDNM